MSVDLSPSHVLIAPLGIDDVDGQLAARAIVPVFVVAAVEERAERGALVTFWLPETPRGLRVSRNPLASLERATGIEPATSS